MSFHTYDFIYLVCFRVGASTQRPVAAAPLRSRLDLSAESRTRLVVLRSLFHDGLGLRHEAHCETASFLPSGLHLFTPGSRVTFAKLDASSLVPCLINFHLSRRESLRLLRRVLLSSNTSTTSPLGAQKKRRREGILRSAPKANNSLQPRTPCSGAAAFCNAELIVRSCYKETVESVQESHARCGGSLGASPLTH